MCATLSSPPLGVHETHLICLLTPHPGLSCLGQFPLHSGQGLLLPSLGFALTPSDVDLNFTTEFLIQLQACLIWLVSLFNCCLLVFPVLFSWVFTPGSSRPCLLPVCEDLGCFPQCFPTSCSSSSHRVLVRLPSVSASEIPG